MARVPAPLSPAPTMNTARAAGPAPTARISLGVPVRAESANFILLLGTTLFLVIFGLVMVLSSSSVESFASTSNFFTQFLKQGLYVLLGLPLMLVASRLTPQFWRRITFPFLLIAMGLQALLLLPSFGYGYGGNRNWLSFGSFSMQPSEFLKVALIIWLASALSRWQNDLRDGRFLLVRVAPVPLLAILVVLAGGDLGTSMVMAAIVLGALYFAGVRLRHLATVFVVSAVAAVAYSMTGSSRQARISAWLSGCANDPLGQCWQIQHGTWALASGGIFGVGLGNSKAKWSWLPEASNDFIFAIIGEELGLIGALVVLALFLVLTVALVRIVSASADPFAKIAVSAILVWLIGQGFINIAVVLGMLPVLGLPLPLISSGGSALIAALLAIGIALSFARPVAR